MSASLVSHTAVTSKNAVTVKSAALLEPCVSTIRNPQSAGCNAGDDTIKLIAVEPAPVPSVTDASAIDNECAAALATPTKVGSRTAPPTSKAAVTASGMHRCNARIFTVPNSQQQLWTSRP